MLDHGRPLEASGSSKEPTDEDGVSNTGLLKCDLYPNSTLASKGFPSKKKLPKNKR